MSDIVRLENISKRFGGTVALDRVSFTIEKGEIHAVVGENGAGKSTLMRILSGVLQKDSGAVYLDGQEAHFRAPIEAFRAGISTVYQEPYLVPYMSVGENIFLGHEQTKKFGFVDFSSINEKAAKVLKLLDLTFSPKEMLRNLSPAEIQMVQIARAIAFSTRILILDEPTSSITEHETDVLFNVLRKLHQDGLTIIYVSHRLREIFDLCSRATVLRDGKHIRTVDIAETSESEIINFMVGRELKLAPAARMESADVKKLELKHVRVSKAPVPLSNISLSVKKGEIVALAGLVGSGRSEIAKTIFGLNPLDSGEIVIDGKSVHIRSPRDAIQYRIGYVPEDRKEQGLVASLSIQQNISLTGLGSISRWGFVNRNAEKEVAVIHQSKLALKAASLDDEVSSLSGGNQQKVVLAKWLWLNPEILILDEPTRGIDVGAKEEIHNIILDLARKGVSILLISSELPEVLKLAERIYVLRDGVIAGELSRAEASQEAIMHLAAIGN